MDKKRFKCRNLKCNFEWETDLNIDQYPDVCPKCSTENCLVVSEEGK